MTFGLDPDGAVVHITGGIRRVGAGTIAAFRASGFSGGDLRTAGTRTACRRRNRFPFCHAKVVPVNLLTPLNVVKHVNAGIQQDDDGNVAAVGVTVPPGRPVTSCEIDTCVVSLASPLVSAVSGAALLAPSGGEVPAFLVPANNPSTPTGHSKE